MVSVSSRPLDAQAAFTNNLAHLFDMHQFVRHVAIEAGYSNSVLGDLELAVVEACANVIKHAYRDFPEDSAPIEIQVQYDWGELAITITDWGRAFDPPATPVAPPNPERMIAEQQRGGMGIFFMQQLMDEVAWDIRPGVCNRVRLVKKRI